MAKEDPMRSHALAVDIGGTFTDVVLRRGDGTVWVDKILTTYNDLLEGFFRGADSVMAQAGVAPEDVDDLVVHATTIVTNALLERKGPKTALLTTSGFRDVLYIRDEYRYDMYDPQIEFPTPLVPRELTFPVVERVLADGTVTVPVERAAIVDLAQTLRREGVVSVAVCFLNAYQNGANERVVGEELHRVAPELHISLSTEVSPQMREYPRTSTTVINAYTSPIVGPYLTRMSSALRERGFPNAPMMMLSNGGVIGVGIAGRFPVRMIESGPAAGALAASYYAQRLGLKSLLSFDMGGTTAKACIIEGGKPLVTGQFEVDRKYRFKAGSGFPVTVPSIDMIEIGAGGGSIAACDNLGLLKVGPYSAGSSPGPVCYNRGGTDICVTDADLALGLLDAENFLGGDMPLDLTATQQRLARLAEDLGVTPAEAAAGIYRVVGETMAAATRTHALDRGLDYRGMPMLAFGGAGPLHACHVAELLGSTIVIVPPQASVLSAFGMLVTPVRYDLVRGALGLLVNLDWIATTQLFEEMIATGHHALTDAGVAEANIEMTFGGDFRYHGQANEVTVNFAIDPLAGRDIEIIRRTFEVAYEAQYGLRLADNEVEIVSWRLTCCGPNILRGATARLAVDVAQPRQERRVALAASGKQESRYQVFDRHAVAGGQTIQGPALIEERETTTVILSEWTARMDESGCLLIERLTVPKPTDRDTIARTRVAAL